MSDKHEAKQKAMRAKAHIGTPEHHAEHVNHTQLKDESIEGQIKEAAGNVQEELSKTRDSANQTHQG